MTCKIILAAVLTVASLAPAPAMAERTPNTMGQDARVRHVTYSPSDVIRVDTNLRVNTAFEMGAGERINQVLLGDSESFEVEVLSNRNTISIKPVISGARTNMTIYTNRRVVAIYLTEGRSSRPTFRVVVVYPDDRRPKTPKRPGGVRDNGYQITSGSGQIRPVRIWNDGTSTFFEFRRAVRPSIFGLNSSGYEVTQNSATRANVIRLNGIRSDYAIRLGDDVVCVRRIAGGLVTSKGQIDAFRAREF